MRSLAIAGLVVASGTVLRAHAAAASSWTTPGALSGWDLAAMATLLVAAGLYVRGVSRLVDRGGRTPLRWRVSFAAGWSVLVFSILPPLDGGAIERFSTHMLQHELMMLAGAPLVIAGRPLATILFGLPARWRVLAGRLLGASPLSSATRALTAPVTVWALHGLVVWIWHAPRLYELAVGDEAVHALQHAMFVVSAALFWWGLIAGRYGRIGYGAAVFFVFTTVIHTGILGAWLTFAPSPLYDTYVERAALLGIDPAADQQLAGLLMWIPAGMVLTVLGIALFAAWLGEAERRARTGPRGVAATGSHRRTDSGASAPAAACGNASRSAAAGFRGP